jgi:hypothetical protein
METTGDSSFAMAWPVIAICAILLGGIVAFQFNGKNFKDSVESIRKTFTVKHRQTTVDPDLALVITTNPAQQLQVVATLSPRGLEPLLAKNLQEVKDHLSAHPKVIHLAVMDAKLNDASAIEHALRAALPQSRIVVIRPGMDRAAIGPMLLARI